MESTGFDFFTVGLVLGGASLGLIGLVMAGGALFPEESERFQRHIPKVIAGLILIGVSGAIMAAFGA